MASVYKLYGFRGDYVDNSCTFDPAIKVLTCTIKITLWLTYWYRYRRFSTWSTDNAIIIIAIDLSPPPPPPPLFGGWDL